MKPKCQMCTICLTDDYDLIRNCELRGMLSECVATNLAHPDPYRAPTRAPKPEKRARP